MTDFEYANGANGFCALCGVETDEEWHAFCRDCFAEREGWSSAGTEALDHRIELVEFGRGRA
jgi:hypothetical protein